PSPTRLRRPALRAAGPLRAASAPSPPNPETPSRDRLARTRGTVIQDSRVLEAVAAVPRDHFVPDELRSEAWENAPLPIGSGQTISQPLVVARMCELLELAPTDRVLDVGTGPG